MSNICEFLLIRVYFWNAISFECNEVWVLCSLVTRDFYASVINYVAVIDYLFIN